MTHTIRIYGDIGRDVTPAQVADAVAAARDKPLAVHINSFGGSAFDGVAIHNMLARHRAPVTVVVDGVAASAASLVAMAGSEIVMPSNTFLMIHEAWGAAIGDADEMRDYAALLEQISNTYVTTYAARTGRTPEEIKEWMRQETWFSAHEARNNGFATRVTDPSEIVVHASAFARQLRHVPAALRHHPEGVITVNDTEAPHAEATTPQAVAPQAASLDDLKRIAALSNGRLDAEWVVSMLEKRATLDDARDAAIAAMANSHQTFGVVQVMRDERETFRARATEALVARMSGARDVKPEAREFVAAGLHGIMREALIQSGERAVHRLSPDAMLTRIVEARNTNSDFPIVLKDAMNKRLQQAYEEVEPTWRVWCQEVDVNDFRNINTANIGEFPSLKRVEEGAEITFGSTEEEGETYKVRTYARIVTFSREAIINDDLNAFNRLISGAGNAGARLILDQTYGVLTENPTMSDGKAVFHADHKNVYADTNPTRYHYLISADRATVEVAYLDGRRVPQIAEEESFNVLGISYRVVFDVGVKAVSYRGMTRYYGNGVTEDTVNKLQQLLMEQKTVSGNYMARPSRLVLLVPPVDYVAAAKLATAVTPAKAADVNIYGGRLTVITESRLA